MSSPILTATGAARKRRHVAFFPFPFFGNPVTFLHLGRKIAATNPDIQISLFGTPFYGMYLYNYISPEEQRNIMVLATDDGLDGNFNVTLEEAMERFVEVAGKSFREALAWAEEFVGVKICCVVGDALLSDVCREIAEERGVKWVAVWTSASAAMAAHMLPHQLRSKIGVEGLEAYREEVVAAGNSSTIAGLLKRMPFNLPKAAAVAINSFDHLEPTVTETLNAAFGNKFLNAGLYSLTLPFPAPIFDKDHPVFSWLDSHQTGPGSVVYISYGINQIGSNYASGKIPSPEDYVALAEGLEASGVTFIWTIATYRIHTYLPEGFWERTTKSGQGMFTPWSHHMVMSILNHPAVGAQFTDGVWNSVMESIVAGVPMICYTSGHADQIFNKRLVEKWGIGVGVEGEKLTKSAVARVLKRVMLEDEGRRMREKIGVTKRQAEAAAAEPGGSSAQNVNKFISFITC